MRIEWNKVTWYSKFLAIVLFLFVFALAFWLGVEYRDVKNEVDNIKTFSTITNPSLDIKDWKTYKNEKYGFKYPKDWGVEEQFIMHSQASSTIIFKQDLGEIEIGGYGDCYTMAISHSEPATKCEQKDNFIIYTWSKDKNILNIFDEVLSTFKVTDVEVNTSDWKTYKNDKYGFEFMYPQDFDFNNDAMSIGKGDGEFVEVNPKNYGEGFWVEYGVQDNQNCNHQAAISALLYREPIIINGFTFLFGKGVEEGFGGERSEFKGYSSIHNGICYQIYYSNTNSTIDVFEGIIQTFKFTK